MRFRTRVAFVVLTSSLCPLVGGCAGEASGVTNPGDVRANLAFICTYAGEQLPALEPRADELFRYARFLEKKDGPKDFIAIARFYRIAAAHGHYKANNNLQRLVSHGKTDSPHTGRETIALASQLTEQGIADGYYDIGHYLEIGYELKRDPEMAMRYYRKAADLGSADAQYYVAEKLAPHDMAPDLARTMRQCATAQGHGRAARKLGISYKNSGYFVESRRALQDGVRAGDSGSISRLKSAFTKTDSKDELYNLDLEEDRERARRYERIGDFISRNEGHNPKVPDVDLIVPLPPAELPDWDGTFAWQKAQDEAIPPAEPGKELIETLSREKGLDPITGIALPAEKSADHRHAQLGTLQFTGQTCLQTGVWQAIDSWGNAYACPRLRLKRGVDLPKAFVIAPRRFELLDRILGERHQWMSVEWKLVGYSDAV